MSAQLTRQGTSQRSSTSTPSRATLRTRPRVQRILIRYWEYIPEVRAGVLALRLLATLVLVITGIALLSSSHWQGLLCLVGALAVASFALWVFTTAAKGWPVR
jgi:hypothetical protein